MKTGLEWKTFPHPLFVPNLYQTFSTFSKMMVAASVGREAFLAFEFSNFFINESETLPGMLIFILITSFVGQNGFSCCSPWFSMFKLWRPMVQLLCHEVMLTPLIFPFYFQRYPSKSHSQTRQRRHRQGNDVTQRGG